MTHPLNFQVQSDGTLTPAARQTCANMIAQFAGQWIKISIEKKKDKRTLDQNEYYWGVIVPHVRAYRLEMGDPVSEDTVHEDLLLEFAPSVPGRRLKGGGNNRAMRSKEMSVEQFSDYITAIIACMANFGAPVPEAK